MLSMCIRETDALAELMPQELMRTQSIWISSYAYAQHKRTNSIFEKGLQNMLIMRIKNLCVHWEYASGTDAHQKLNDA